MKIKLQLTSTILLILGFFLVSIFNGGTHGVYSVSAETIGTILFTYPNWFYDGNLEGTRMGSAVSAAGDVNDDGKQDVLIGSELYYAEGVKQGTAFVFYSSGGSLSSYPNWIANIGQKGSLYGSSVSGLRDVNGDGIDDIVVGASDYNLMDGDTVLASKAGAVFVYYGSKTFSDKTIADWVYKGDQAKEFLGKAVNGVGDINKDGYADMLVGAPYYHENSLTDNGKVFLFLGAEGDMQANPAWTAIGDSSDALFGSAVSNAGDTEKDGYKDIIVGAPQSTSIGYAHVFYNTNGILETEPSWSVTNGKSESQFGAAVAGVGDVNKDGHDDVLIGAPATKVLIDGYPFSAGCVYLYLGDVDGLESSPAWTYCADQAGGRFGASVAAAGDMNQDGFDDFLVGMPFFSVSNEKQGAVYLFFGGVGGVKGDYFERTLGNKADTEFGASVSSAGDVNNDGRVDVVVGAPNYKSGEDRPGRAMTFYAGIPGEPDFLIFPVYIPLVSTGN